MPDKTYDRLIRTLWTSEIKSLNDHLPKDKKLLSELLKEDKPFIYTKGGDRLFFKKEELKEIEANISNENKSSLRLPLIFIRRMDLGQGVYSLSGGKIEVDVVNNLLELNKISLKMSYSLPYIYKPQLFFLKRKYRTIISLGFGSSSLIQ